MKRGALLINGLLGLTGALTLFPLVLMVSVSFMPAGTSATYPPPLFPAHPTMANYTELWTHAGMARHLGNSMLLATLATLLSLTLNVSAGYAFAKIEFPGRETVAKAMLAALVIPAQVAMDAARIDGASEWTIYRRVALPLMRPMLVTLGVFTFLGSWNDFLWPLIVLNDSSRYTLPVALAALSREHVQDNELMMAGSVVTVVPVLLLFLLLQRHYLAGLMVGAVKG